MRFQTLITTLWAWPFSQFSIQLTVCPYRLNFMRILEETVLKAVSKSTLSSLTKPVIQSQKVIKLVKHDIPLVNPWWRLLLIFMSFTCLEMVFRISCSITFPGIEVKLTSLFSLTLKVRATFLFLQEMGTSPSHQNFNQILLRGTLQWQLPVTSALVVVSH